MTRIGSALLAACASLACLLNGAVVAAPLELAAVAGTGFTFQGKLTGNGAPVTGACDFKFTLWDAFSRLRIRRHARRAAANMRE